jgi:hypothetical protein
MYLLLVHVLSVQSAYRTTRQYKKPASLREQDEETAVNCTLLEYGRRYGLSGLTKMKKKGEKESAKAAIAASLGGQTEEEAAAEEVCCHFMSY